MVLIHRIVSYFLSKPVRSCSHPFVGHSCLVLAKLFHGGTETENDKVVSGICDSFRRGCNWEILSRKYDSLELSSSLVQQVLLELKEPPDAKGALGFFHWSAQRKSVVHGIESYCIIIHILVRAQLLMDARALLESVLKKSQEERSKFLVADCLLGSYMITASSPFVFDVLIQAYAKLRMFEIGFDVCCYLEEHRFSLSLISFNSLIHVVQKSDKSLLVWKIYEHMIHRRVFPSQTTIRIMIDALCKQGKLQTAVDILDKIHGKRCSPTVIVNSYLVIRILEEGRIEDGMALLKRMLQKNMILDTSAYSLTVYAKVKLGNLSLAWDVYEEMLNRGFNANSFVHTLFLGAYCKAESIEAADQLLQDMENIGLKPYDETFNFLIEGCAKIGKVKESLSYCEKMLEKGLVPSLSVFNGMVRRLHEAEDVDQANAMLSRLLDKGFSPNDVTYSCLMAGYEKVGQIQEVFKLFYEMEYKQISSRFAFESLIRSLCHCGKLEEAEKYLNMMEDRVLNPSENIYEAVITGYFERGDRTRALHIYNEMVSYREHESLQTQGGKDEDPLFYFNEIVSKGRTECNRALPAENKK